MSRTSRNLLKELGEIQVPVWVMLQHSATSIVT